MTRIAAALVLFAAVLAPARGALAYSELGRFGESTELGGGDGHWFTGSPTDGYTCDVCHESTRGVPVEIHGLPERYQLGATYEVLLTWPPTIEHVSALVEFTDEHGKGVGSVLLPGESAMGMTDADACAPLIDIPAAERFLAPDANVASDRQIIGLADCGGRQFRMQWTAPAEDAGPIFFSGGVVQSDTKDDLLGDNTLVLSRPILSAAQSEYVVETQGGCALAAVRTRPCGFSTSGLLLCVAIVLVNRSRRRRR